MIRKFLISCIVLSHCTLAAAQQFAKIDLFDNEDYSSFFLLDNKLVGKQLLMLAQNHEYRTTNALLGLKLMKYLHQKEGFRYCLLDAGIAESLLIEDYIQNGDSLLYAFMVDALPKEELVFYRGLYNYNSRLNASERIHLRGIGPESNLGMVAVALHQLLPDKEVPEDISTSVLVLQQCNELYRNHIKYVKYIKQHRNSSIISGYDFTSTLKQFLMDVGTKRIAFEQFLGANFQDFMKICDGLRETFQITDFKNADAVQAEILEHQLVYSRIKNTLQDFPQEKFFMPYNFCRSMEVPNDFCSENQTAFDLLIDRLNSNDVLKGKVFSIASYYSKSMYDMITEFPEIVAPLDQDGLTMIDFSTSENKNHAVQFSSSDLVIVNQAFPLSDGTRESNIEWERKKNEDNYIDSKVFYDFRYSQLFYSIDALNSSLWASGKANFHKPFEFYGGGFTWLIGRFYSSMGMEGMKKQRVRSGDSLSLSLDAFSANWRMGGDLIANKYVDLSPYLGIGIARMKLLREEILPDSAQTGFFGYSTHRNTVATNPAVLFQSGLDFRINLGFIFFGFNAGYQWDVSNKKWRSGGEIDLNSPYISHRSFIASVHCGLYVSL